MTDQPRPPADGGHGAPPPESGPAGPPSSGPPFTPPSSPAGGYPPPGGPGAPGPGPGYGPGPGTGPGYGPAPGTGPGYGPARGYGPAGGNGPGPGGYGPGNGYPGHGPGPGGPGYGGSPAGPPPPGYASVDDKTWALIAHFGGAAGWILLGVGGWVAPLIVMLAKTDSPTVRAHAVAALNFQLFWSIVSVVGSVVAFCGTFIIIGAVFWIVPVVAAIAGIVFGIVAGVKANEGVLYRYPTWFTFIG